MRWIALIVTCFFASGAMAQDDRSFGLSFGAETGFEYIHYTENFANKDYEPAMLEGSSSAIVGTFSAELDLSRMLKLAPFFVGFSIGIPLITFPGTEHGTFIHDGVTYINQKQDIVHEDRMVRAFFGYNAKPVFTPFILFERSIFQSTRSNMLVGTDSGVLVPADTNVIWKERVWSSHFGAGFRGGIPLNAAQDLSVRYRVAVMFPLSSFVTNSHPEVYSQGQTLGQDATGLSFLARLALQYEWDIRSSVHLSVGISTRSWGGDGQVTPNASWPANVMEAIPVLLGVTWAL